MRIPFRAAPVLVATALLGSSVSAEVSLTRGATPIIDGEAIAEGDITLQNDALAFTLAVESQAPWGVPRGAIVDLAAVRDGTPGRDRIAFADFIPNNWSAWPNDRLDVEVVTDTPEMGVVRIKRDFGETEIDTTYTLEAGSDRIHLVTVMTNNGDAAQDSLLSGFTLWPDSGYLFAVPGLAGRVEAPAEDALADRVVAYDRDWAIALHAPYFDQVRYSSKDLYLGHDLAPGESRRFEGWLQVVPAGDLAPVVKAEIDRESLPAGKVAGRIASGSEAVPESILVIEKADSPYAWTIAEDGRFNLDLPAGDYTVYATAEGYSNSARREISVEANGSAELDFDDLQAPGTLRLDVSDDRAQPLDARITIAEGQSPLVEFLGRRAFFTELDEMGRADLHLAPGDYVFEVGHGAGFMARATQLDVTVVSGEAQEMEVTVDMLARPSEGNWYASDMHHHADQLEGTTPPEFLMRSELAAGLDLVFVSDHDSVANHVELADLTAKRGIPFIPSIELSSSWGHFNAYPLDIGAQLEVDTSTATAAEILADARRMGADAIQSNHPYIPYGYLASLEAGKVPGGFAPDIDLLELNGPDDDQRVFDRAASLWTQGHDIFLSAGSDAHDVWNDETGQARAYAYVSGGLTAEAFVAALEGGHAYMTRGPLIDPDVVFGRVIRLEPGQEKVLGFDLTGANGLARARLMGPEGEIATQEFEAASTEGRAEFTVKTGPESGDRQWVAIIVEDGEGKNAYSNPIWIEPLTEATLIGAEE